jgi:soluble cytochrome b562
MKYRQQLKASTAQLFRSPRFYILGALCCCTLILLFALHSRRRTPVVETITTEEASQTRIAPRPAVQFTPQLPQRDADIEAAGDHIAAATVFLKNRQSAAALRAMTQARSATAHAIDRRRQQGKGFDLLEETLREIDSAERYVQHGALSDARARLISLNNRLDDSLEH